MLRHALKLVWNRRRATSLVIVEIAAAFVVTFVLLALAVRAWSNYQQPLGFDYRDVWRVELSDDNPDFGPRQRREQVRDTVDDLISAIRSLPRAAAAHSIAMTPFDDRQVLGPYGADADSLVLTRRNTLSTAALQALGVRLIDGRWFGREDEGQDYRPVLVNTTFVKQAFGPDASPLGRRINFTPPGFLERLPEDVRREVTRELRVVGVIEDFRQFGEFSDEMSYVIFDEGPDDVPMNLFVKVAPRTDVAFEAKILETVEAVAPGWAATITPWEQLRATRHSRALLPLKAGATLGAFLLAMVVLGLIGIVWQDVVRRAQELGLRRASGATAAGVRRQIVVETLVVGALGTLLGTVVAVQFPLLELVQPIDWRSALPAIVLSFASILALVTLSALYPAWLASRREPADALRYE